MLIRVLLIVLATTGAAFSEKLNYGEWFIGTKESTFTDGLDVAMATQSEKDISCGKPSSQSNPLQLAIWCENNTTILYVKANHCFFTSNSFNDYGHIKYRIDKLPTKIREFSASTTNQGLGLFIGSKSIPFIKELIGHDKLAMQITPYRETAETVIFSLNGFDDKIKQVRQACNW